MRKIKEILRLKYECGLTNRKIAKSCAISRSTVADYLLRIKAAGIAWPLSEEMDETALERHLFPPQENLPEIRLVPDWSAIHRELKRKGG